VSDFLMVRALTPLLPLMTMSSTVVFHFGLSVNVTRAVRAESSTTIVVSTSASA